ncbi:hypothetical protein [Photobacterium damselae]|uniref:hypothetical protein n=1 Tax=Photobacterium damselae TaxID=38293 RepID=UPI00370BFB3F
MKEVMTKAHAIRQSIVFMIKTKGMSYKEKMRLALQQAWSAFKAKIAYEARLERIAPKVTLDKEVTHQRHFPAFQRGYRKSSFAVSSDKKGGSCANSYQ